MVLVRGQTPPQVPCCGFARMCDAELKDSPTSCQEFLKTCRPASRQATGGEPQSIACLTRERSSDS